MNLRWGGGNKVYYDKEGNLIGGNFGYGTLSTNNPTYIVFDSAGNIRSISILSSANPYAIPGTETVTYDGDGRVVKRNENGTNMYGSYTTYDLTAEQLSTFTGGVADTIATYVTGRCQTFPEASGCSTNS